MSKAERLIEMMITINAKRHFKVSELAEEFSVSKRTVLRDLQSLEQAGFPLYSEVGAAGGYHVLKERVLPPITFSENEAKAVFFAYQSLQFYNKAPEQGDLLGAGQTLRIPVFEATSGYCDKRSSGDGPLCVRAFRNGEDACSDRAVCHERTVVCPLLLYEGRSGP